MGFVGRIMAFLATMTIVFIVGFLLYVLGPEKVADIIGGAWDWVWTFFSELGDE